MARKPTLIFPLLSILAHKPQDKMYQKHESPLQFFRVEVLPFLQSLAGALNSIRQPDLSFYCYKYTGKKLVYHFDLLLMRSVLSILQNGRKALIGVQDKRKVDYTNALFGFIPDGQNQESESDYPPAYKSRIRFSPLDIQGKVQFRKVENLLLMTPSATVSGMYLRQPSGEKLTYEDDNIELNGYKYYHVLPEPIVPKIKDEKLKNMVSARKIHIL